MADACGAEHRADVGLTRIGVCFGGIADDYRRRLPHYWSDLRMACTRKTISSALFMFFATFASTVALGVVIKRNTQCSDASDQDKAHCVHGQSLLGASEWLVINSVAGVAHALLGCQPLLVLRPTGPITAFVTLLFDVSGSLDLPFFVFLAWTGIFVSVYMTLIAGLELSRFIRLLTRFTHDIFAVFVCSIYVVDGIQGVAGRFSDEKLRKYPDQDHSVAESLWSFNLTLLLLAIAFSLHTLSSSRIFTAKVRAFLVDYALTLATALCVFVSYCPIWSDEASIDVERIDLNDQQYQHQVTVRPTLTSRAWFVDFGQSTPKVVLAALISAIPITIFFYFDQNVSSLLCQQDRMHLKKGRYFHSSFVCMAAFNLIGPLFGLPFVTGSLPHSPQMVHALTETAEPGPNRASFSLETEQAPPAGEHRPAPLVHENRLAPFLMYFLIGLVVVAPFGRDAIETIPNAAVDGILIFVGIAGMLDTELWARIQLLFTEADSFPPGMGFSPSWLKPSKLRLFTVLQLGALALAWVLNGLAMGTPALAPLGLCFPFVVVALVPFRLKVLPLLFESRELEALDSEDAPADERLEDLLYETVDKGAERAVWV